MFNASLFYRQVYMVDIENAVYSPFTSPLSFFPVRES